VAHEGEAAGGRVGLGQQVGDVGGFGVGAGEAVLEAPEAGKPVARLRQGDADMPGAALARFARQRHHRAERHQIARGVVERLRG
jgi:hypothetical protein